MAAIQPLTFPNWRPGLPFVTGIYGDKGGIGKSTLATNLAYELARRDIGDVALIDVNKEQKFSSSSTVYQRMKTEPGYVCTVEDEPANLANVRKIPRRWVILDLPPSPREAKAALEECDLIIIPAIPSEYLVMQGVMETISRVLPKGGPVPVVLLSKVSPPRDEEKESPLVKTLRQGFAGMNVAVFDTVIRRYQAHSDAQAAGFPVTHSPAMYDRGDKAAKDVVAFVDEFTMMTGAQ